MVFDFNYLLYEIVHITGGNGRLIAGATNEEDINAFKEAMRKKYPKRNYYIVKTKIEKGE